MGPVVIARVLFVGFVLLTLFEYGIAFAFDILSDEVKATTLIGSFQEIIANAASIFIFASLSIEPALGLSSPSTPRGRPPSSTTGEDSGDEEKPLLPSKRYNSHHGAFLLPHYPLPTLFTMSSLIARAARFFHQLILI